MKVKVNSDLIELTDQSSLGYLLQQLFLKKNKGMAVAVNAEVVNHKKWDEFLLNENDEVIIIEAAQGG